MNKFFLAILVLVTLNAILYNSMAHEYDSEQEQAAQTMEPLEFHNIMPSVRMIQTPATIGAQVAGRPRVVEGPCYEIHLRIYGNKIDDYKISECNDSE